MGAGAWIGNSTTTRGVTIAGAFRTKLHGLTFRIAGTGSTSLALLGTAGQHTVYEDCYLWQGSSGATAAIIAGVIDGATFCELRNCTLRFSGTTENKAFFVGCKMVIVGGSVSSAGSIPACFARIGTQDPGGTTLDVIGMDLSAMGSSSLIGDTSTAAGVARFSQCKLGSGYVMLSTQTRASRAGAEVYVFDCASGDTHGLFGYANAMGSVVSDTGIYVTAGAAAQSWKIVTTANCSFYTPFETPWLGYYNTGTSAITPYIEILRDGSATAYQDDEVWMDIAAKVTTTSTIATLYSDRMTPLGTPANQAAGAGTGSWTGENATAWSGKCAIGSSITPAETGHIQARIVVGEPSITVYADPQIRT